jgi:hypothetical protein
LYIRTANKNVRKNSFTPTHIRLFGNAQVLKMREQSKEIVEILAEPF